MLVSRTRRARAGLRPTGRPLQFFDDPERNPQSLGCSVCQHREVCGGLHVSSGAFDCLSYCCRRPHSCDSVCINKVASFVARVREVGGFGLKNVPRARPLPPPEVPEVVPLVYHGSSRMSAFPAPAVALSLYNLFDRRTGVPKYTSRDQLCDDFRVSRRASLLISGTHNDRPLERWWALGPARILILRQLAEFGISVITSPNFSLFSNTPRWDDLHSMKRIAITWQEMQSAGLPSALHLNARTTYDWRRWRDFVSERPEVNLVAFEFATGAKDPERMRWYADQLCALALEVGRPLTIVIRGGTAVVSQLRDSYEAVCTIDTTPFIKAMRRRRAKRRAGGGIEWESVAGNGAVSLDELLEHNFLTIAWDRSSTNPGNLHRDQQSVSGSSLMELSTK